MPGLITTKRPYRSRLKDGLIAASPARLVREERLIMLRLLADWIRTRRYAPTVEDLHAKRPDLKEAPLRLRLLDLGAEGLALNIQHGWQPTADGWDLIGREPIEVLFSSNKDEREKQYRMLAYYRQAQKTPRFPEMLAYWNASRPEREA